MIEKEKIVEKVVTQVVKEEVKVVETQMVEVEKQVEVVVTPTPEPAPQQQMIMGFPAATEAEAKSAQAAYDAAPKCQPDPAWKDQKFTIGVYSAGQRGAISGPTYFWRGKFEEMTGASYDIVEIPFAEMREKIFTDFQTGADQVRCHPELLQLLRRLHRQRLRPAARQVHGRPQVPEVGARVGVAGGAQPVAMGRPVLWHANDHDAQVLYYRKDIINDPKWQAEYKKEMGEDMPVAMDTWEDVLKIAQFFNGKDWNGDGDPDDGITLHLKVGGQGFFHFMALSAPYVTTPAAGDDPKKVTKYNNIYYFDPDTMEPLINSPGHVKACETLIDLSKAGPSAMWGWSLGEAWADFLSGNALMTFSWGDVGSLAQDPDPVGDPGQAGRARHPGHQGALRHGEGGVHEPGEAEHGRQPGGLLVASGALQVRQEPRAGLLLDGLAGDPADQPLERLHGLDRRGPRHHL